MVSQLQSDPESLRHAREYLGALRDDRRDAFRNDIIRSLIFIGLAALLIIFYTRRKLAATWMIAGVTILSSFDLISFSAKYLEEHSYDSKDKFQETEFPLTRADIMIQQDPDPNFRVFNASKGLDECKTSYYHKSIGGYHPAKIGIYDDLLAYQLGRQNMSVINMLNTKYVIQEQGGQLAALRNPGALGNAWFVKGIHWVKGPVEEMKAMDNFNPADTAVADEKYKPQAGLTGEADSTDEIRQTYFNNDTIVYQSSTRNARTAVFSEIYYKDWKCYIDGKPADYFKVNYVLRGLNIPSGKHEISFRFEPAVFFLSKTITMYAGWFITLLVLISAYFLFVKNKRQPV
jgi:hypothetical protein